MYSKTLQISDTIHGTVRLNYLEKKIISTQIFNRLHNISQNSTAYLTFPTNRTKRFEHSIGTMSLCGKIFKESITNSDDKTLDEFFSNIEILIDREIENNLKKYSNKYRAKIGDCNLKSSKLLMYKYAKVESSYNGFIPVNIKEKYRNIYVILFQSVRIAALMHDVGHPPFSHITEFALKNVYKEINATNEESRTSRERRFISSISKYFNNGQHLHEQISNIITDKVLDDIIENIRQEDESVEDIIESQLFKIIIREITMAILNEKNKTFADLHRIIDGSLDGDRLDYVSRDPINSGFNVGIIEYERIINTMKLIKIDGSYIFSPSSKVIDSIEDFFNRRWRMYKQIINHHRVIKTDYLLQSSIEKLSLDYLKSEKIEINEDNILPYDISGIWKALEDKASYKVFFDSLIQWDDAWLMTILKKHYFSSAIESDMNTFYKLEELLANKKNYFAIVKRMEDFIEIDKEVARIMEQEYDSISKLVKEIKNQDLNGDLGFKRILNYILKLEKSIIKYNNHSSYLPKDGFILAKIKKVYSNLFEENWLGEIIFESVDQLKLERDDIKDTITIIKKINTGIKGGERSISGGLGVHLERDNNISVMNFTDLSNLGNILLADINSMPVFYLYILKSNDKLDYDAIKKELGNLIARKISQKIMTKLESIKK